jgi:glycosyltransferase involved in cell wall biosynthesis
MAVLEAMAAGVPVVATRVGGIPLAVRDGVDGFLVAPGGVKELANALVKLLRDETLRHRMGTSARQRASEQFAADVIVPRLAALWAEVLAPAAMQETA